MKRSITPLYGGDILKQLEKEWEMQRRAQAERVGKRYAAILEGLLQQTTRHWNESGENRYAKPVPKSRVTIDHSGGKYRVKVHIVMIGEGGNPSFLWHILDQGRRAYVFPSGKRTPPIRERKRRRTFADQLQVDPFPGFTGETFVITGGTTVKAVPPNDWYKTAIEQTIDIAKRDSELKDWLPKRNTIVITGI